MWDSKKNLHTDISIYFHFISSSYKFQIVLTKQFQMKYLIIIISVFINTGKIIAQSPKLDTIVSVKWFGSAWQNNSRTINNYDADCRLKTALTQNWDITGKWVDYSIKRYSYISGNYISEILTQLWLNNAWTDNYKQIYTYDVSLKILSIVDQSWNIDHWSNYKSISNKYDSNGYVDSVITQSSYNDEPFENTNLDIYMNDNDGTPLQTINQFWKKVSLYWANYSKTSFVYNNNKTIHIASVALWDNNTALWQANMQTVYTYTGIGKLYNYVLQQWQTNQWINQWLYSCYFDTNGFPSGVLTEQWDGFDWEKYRQYSDKNNNDGSIHQHTTQYWVEAQNTWVNDLRETYSYSGPCLLPLNLLLFTATKNGNNVNLNWKDAGETNVSHFMIQRSFSGNDFVSLGNIPAKSVTGTNSYDYPDNIEKINAAKIYYRLKIIDKDQSYAYSKVVPVALSIYTGTLKVYPDPAKDELFVLFKMQSINKAQLQITDVLGKIVYSNTINNDQQNNIAVVDISLLSKGIYFVSLITGNDIQRTQFIKQ